MVRVSSYHHQISTTLCQNIPPLQYPLYAIFTYIPTVPSSSSQYSTLSISFLYSSSMSTTESQYTSHPQYPPLDTSLVHSQHWYWHPICKLLIVRGGDLCLSCKILTPLPTFLASVLELAFLFFISAYAFQIVRKYVIRYTLKPNRKKTNVRPKPHKNYSDLENISACRIYEYSKRGSIEMCKMQTVQGSKRFAADQTHLRRLSRARKNVRFFGIMSDLFE